MCNLCACSGLRRGSAADVARCAESTAAASRVSWPACLLHLQALSLRQGRTRAHRRGAVLCEDGGQGWRQGQAAEAGQEGAQGV